MDRSETEYEKLLAEYEKAVDVYSRAIHTLTAGGAAKFKKAMAAVTIAHARCDEIRTRLNAARKKADSKRQKSPPPQF